MTLFSLEIADVWTPTLELSTTELQAIAFKPLKWLRHMGWCIYGAPGSPSTQPDGQPIDAAAEETTNDFAAEYYYIAEGPPRYMDVSMLDDYSETDAGNMRDSFREPIFERDGGTCVFLEGNTDEQSRLSPDNSVTRDLVQAAHIIPHCRGDEYVKLLQDTRQVPRDLRLYSVDDIRNGILIWSDLHRLLSMGHSTILLVPNKYMDIADAPVGPAERADWPPPESDDKEYTVDELEEKHPSHKRDTEQQRSDQDDSDGDLDSGYVPFTPESRLILQHLGEPIPMYKSTLPNNLRAALRPWTRLSPAALHASYGCAIFNRFGVAPPSPSPSDERKFEEEKEKDHPRKRQKTETSSMGMDKAWDFLLEVHRPPPHIARQQEEAHKAEATYSQLRTRARIHLHLEKFDNAVADFKSAIQQASSDGASNDGDVRALKTELKKAEAALKRSKTRFQASRGIALNKGGDGEKFKLVVEANAVLSDPQHREQYDMGEDEDGMSDASGMGGMHGMDLSEIFAQFHGGGGGGFGGGGFHSFGGAGSRGHGSHGFGF